MPTDQQSPSLHLIYVPGLGDNYDPFRAKWLSRWRSRGVKVTFVSMKWRRRDETAEEKVVRITEAIERYPAARTVLIGESAGGATVLVAGSRSSSVDKIITLQGKNVRADRVSPSIYRNNTAFIEIMRRADELAAKRTESSTPVTMFRAFADVVVFRADMAVPFAKMKQLPTFGHFFGISSVLVALWPIIIREAKRK